jgi:DNA end-binding protein Ku
MIHEPDGARITQKRFCSREDKEVPWEEIAKGYPISKRTMVKIDPAELEALDPEATRTIDIVEFVELSQIDPLFYDHHYYVGPEPGAEKAYALLHQAMAEKQRVAIARMVMRTKQYLCAVRPLARALCLTTMQYADEIVPEVELEGLPSSRVKPSAGELKMAAQLIDTLAVRHFDPSRYKDEYRERVLELIERKAAGEEIVVQEEAPARRAAVVDLMAALRASLERRGRAPEGEAKGEAGGRPAGARQERVRRRAAGGARTRRKPRAA